VLGRGAKTDLDISCEPIAGRLGFPRLDCPAFFLQRLEGRWLYVGLLKSNNGSALDIPADAFDRKPMVNRVDLFTDRWDARQQPVREREHARCVVAVADLQRKEQVYRRPRRWAPRLKTLDVLSHDGRESRKPTVSRVDQSAITQWRRLGRIP
jgi:hypothetical protein